MNRRPLLTFSFILSPLHTANASLAPGAAFSQRLPQNTRESINPRRRLDGADGG